jgi:hypothetical protein
LGISFGWGFLQVGDLFRLPISSGWGFLSVGDFFRLGISFLLAISSGWGFVSVPDFFRLGISSGWKLLVVYIPVLKFFFLTVVASHMF